jgi:hypothetical protein
MSTKWFVLFTAVLIGATLHISAAGNYGREGGTSKIIAATTVTRTCPHCRKTAKYTVWDENDSVVCSNIDCGREIKP